MRRLGRAPILDVGAAQGFLGRLLQGSGLQLDAVEPNAAWAAPARPYYGRVYQASIEDAPLPAGHYRVVVCADVLEHTVDPLAAIQRLRQAATADGCFVISVPNVAHLSARLLLLAGRFPRMERGIFDRTHLHYFTRATLVDLLEAAGLRVVECRSTPFPLGLLWGRRPGRALVGVLMRAQGPLLRLAPTLFAYQWIVVAEPRAN